MAGMQGKGGRAAVGQRRRRAKQAGRTLVASCPQLHCPHMARNCAEPFGHAPQPMQANGVTPTKPNPELAAAVAAAAAGGKSVRCGWAGGASTSTQDVN